MKFVESSKIFVNKPGTVRVLVEEPDDVWLVYNLIAPGDVITATIIRKGDRAKVPVEISITSLDYHKDSSTVRVQGTAVSGGSKRGAFHTFHVEPAKEFDIHRVWDAHSIGMLRQGLSKLAGADLAVVLLQPTGIAQIFLVGPKETRLCATVAITSGANKYFENVFRAFVKHVDLSVVRCVVIGSQGGDKDEFRRFMIAEAQRQKVKSVEKNKQRIVVFDAKNKGKDGNISLHGVLRDGAVADLIKDTSAALEIKAFNEFSGLLKSDMDRVCYGNKNVQTAHNLRAIKTLLITHDLYENVDYEMRLRYGRFVECVKKAGGQAFVFPADHVFGEELAKLTGIAAILRFPLPDLEEMTL